MGDFECWDSAAIKATSVVGDGGSKEQGALFVELHVIRFDDNSETMLAGEVQDRQEVVLECRDIEHARDEEWGGFLSINNRTKHDTTFTSRVDDLLIR
jgi:hypothetical protein